MTLNRNPDNFFAETEQVAFHTGHVVPGIDFTNDPLLQGRLFSYIDTQLRRVGPNFHELPINRSLRAGRQQPARRLCPHDHQQGQGVVLPQQPGRRLPDAFAGRGRGVPLGRGQGEPGAKVRERSPSFTDHFSQATQFWNSMSDWEKDHIAAAFAFELNQVVDEGVRDRTMNEILVNIHEDLADHGLRGDRHRRQARPARPRRRRLRRRRRPGPLRKDADKLASPALSMDKPAARPSKAARSPSWWATASTPARSRRCSQALADAELVPETIGPHAGTVAASGRADEGQSRRAQRAIGRLRRGAGAVGRRDRRWRCRPLAQRFIHEAWRHGKPIAVAPDAEALLEAAGVPALDDGVTVAERRGLGSPADNQPCAAPLSTPRFGAAAVLAMPPCKATGRPKAYSIEPHSYAHRRS